MDEMKRGAKDGEGAGGAGAERHGTGGRVRETTSGALNNIQAELDAAALVATHQFVL